MIRMDLLVYKKELTSQQNVKNVNGLARLKMDENIKTIMILISYGILIWSLITNSLTRAVIGLGLLYLIGLDKK